LILPVTGTIEAFAMVVDINAFTVMVSKSDGCCESVAQFVRDVLSGGIEIVEEQGGNVVSFMGDAFLSIFEKIDSVYKACVGIARDTDRQCEWISDIQRDYPDAWKYAIGGPSIKIGIEYGWIDISSIRSNGLGQQKLLIGPPINYASRIAADGEGNRCHVGPEAMKHGMKEWHNSGPYTISGKPDEVEYTYWRLHFDNIWKEGFIEEGEDTYWG
jgi:class 3 adenylate cyclase